MLAEPRFNWLCPECARQVLDILDFANRALENHTKPIDAPVPTERETSDEDPHAGATLSRWQRLRQWISRK